MRREDDVNPHKVMVKVRADFDVDGRITPLKLRTPTGSPVVIEQITEITPAPALKAGGMGLRYTCRVGQKEFYLFMAHNRWFVER